MTWSIFQSGQLPKLLRIHETIGQKMVDFCVIIRLCEDYIGVMLSVPVTTRSPGGTATKENVTSLKITPLLVSGSSS